MWQVMQTWNFCCLGSSVPKPGACSRDSHKGKSQTVICNPETTHWAPSPATTLYDFGNIPCSFLFPLKQRSPRLFDLDLPLQGHTLQNCNWSSTKTCSRARWSCETQQKTSFLHHTGNNTPLQHQQQDFPDHKHLLAAGRTGRLSTPQLMGQYN